MYYSFFEQALIPAEIRALERDYNEGRISAEDAMKQQEWLLSICGKTEKER